MNRLFLIALIVLLSSCVSLRYGNFTQVSKDSDFYLASDAATQLTKLYPPARNTFRLSQPVRDNFGLQLIELLRKQGYGIVENIRPRYLANFYYVLDESKPGTFYRVSLFMGTHALSRAYVMEQGVLQPVSAWSNKE